MADLERLNFSMSRTLANELRSFAADRGEGLSVVVRDALLAYMSVKAPVEPVGGKSGKLSLSDREYLECQLRSSAGCCYGGSSLLDRVICESPSGSELVESAAAIQGEIESISDRLTSLADGVRAAKARRGRPRKAVL